MSLSGFRSQQPPPRQNANLQWERFSVAVGNNLIGRMATTGFQIANVQIDNLSGSWLQLNPGGFFVPPYTLGWATNLIPSANSIDIIFTSAPPLGFSSSSQGSAINVAIYNEALGNEVGSAYITTNPTPSYIRNGYNALPIASGIATGADLVVPLTTQTIRLLRAIFSYDLSQLQFSPNKLTDSGCTATLSAIPVSGIGPTFGLVTLSITPENRVQTMEFSEGFNLPEGYKLNVNNIWSQWGLANGSGTFVIVSCFYYLV